MNIKKRLIITLIVSSLFLLATLSVEAADETINDPVGDVASMNDITGETTVVTVHPDIQVDNLDIVNATYTKTGMTATVTLQVQGSIENRGKIEEPDPSQMDFNINTVEYWFQLITSMEQYDIIYSNHTCQLTDTNDVTNLTSSDFSVTDGTLSITFNLKSAEETYESLQVTSFFMKVNFSSENIPTDPDDLANFYVYLLDVAPNPPLEIFEAYAPNIGSAGEEIQFNGSVSPLTGQPPYSYEWNFGDGETSNKQNPTHIYTKAGSFTYNFTITDQSDATAYETGTIAITQEGGSTGPLSTQMILFLAVLLIIIVVGVVVIVMIIRR
jgi:PKD repeat protein